MRRLGLDEPWTGSAVALGGPLVDGQDLQGFGLTWQRDRTSARPPPTWLVTTDQIVIAQDRKMSDVLLSPVDDRNALPYSRPVTPDHGHRVGVYGLGAIGYRVARNLANSLSCLPLVVCNRTLAKSEKLASELGPNKISIVQSPTELVNSCDIMYALSALKPAYDDLLASASQFSGTTRRSRLHTSSSIKLSRYKFRVVVPLPDLTSDGKATSSGTAKIFVESSTVRLPAVTLRTS